MATSSVSYTFAPNDTIASAKLNQNNTDLVNFLNNSVVHKDGSTTMTGVLSLPASDPVSANQAARKAYVDAADIANTNRSIQVFATTAARDAAITVPTKGQTVYISSSDASEGLYSYGTAWRKGASWNAPWGYLTTITGPSINTVLRAGASSATVTILSGSYTHVANRRVRVTCMYHLTWTSTVGSAARSTVNGTSINYDFNSDWTQGGDTLVGFHTASGSATTYALTCEFLGSNSNVTVGSIVPTITLEDIGPSGAPS